MMLGKIFAALVLLTCGPLWAQDGSTSPQNNQEWKRVRLGDYISEPGEALPHFLLRTAHVLHDFTRQSGNEACGAIGSDGSRYAFSLYTDGVPHGCSVWTSEIPKGFSYVGETIHSHPWQKVLKMTPSATAWSRHYHDGNERSSSIRNEGANGFSKADKANGDGWLVAGGALLHRVNGKNTREEIL